MERKTKVLIPLVLLPFTLLNGCATHKDVLNLEDRMSTSEKREKEIQQEVASLDSLISEQTDLLYSIRAELRTGLESVTRDMEAVGEAVKYGERADYTGGPLTSETDQTIGVPPVSVPRDEEGTVVAEGELTPGGSVSQDTTENAGAGELNLKRAIYDTAYLDMVRGNYELAIQGFEQFIETGSQKELQDNAQYWIGESLYSVGKHDEAITAFQVVVEEYPRGNKVPAALFKIGKCYYELNDSEEASRYFQSVVGGYPHSEEAKLATEYLSDLR